MSAKDRSGFDIAGVVILGILLVIVLRAALENFFIPVFEHRDLQYYYANWPPDEITVIRSGQLFIFLVLLGRFYGGAYRYNQLSAELAVPISIAGMVINVIFTFGLFSLFYVTATQIWTTDIFYALLGALHLFDTVWFLVILIFYQKSQIAGIAGSFIGWNTLTFIAAGILLLAYGNDFWNHRNFSLQTWLLVSLFVISIIDWIVLRKFYFKPDQWLADHAGVGREESG